MIFFFTKLFVKRYLITEVPIYNTSMNLQFFRCKLKNYWSFIKYIEYEVNKNTLLYILSV